jgi:DNA repair protein RadA/Sms
MTTADTNTHSFIAQPTVQAIRNVVIPDHLRIRIKTSDVVFNSIYGGGIVPSSVNVIVGGSGLGKSTTAQRLADLLCAEGHVVLYNAGEEDPRQVKMALERTKCESLLTRGFISNFDDVDQLLEMAEKLRVEVAKKSPLLPNGQPRFFFLFQDSIQTLASEHGGPGRQKAEIHQQTDAVWKIVEWCKKTLAVSFLISQVTKTGDFAGKNELKHAIDTFVWLYRVTKKTDDDFGRTYVEASKNRFGQTSVPYFYKLGENGVSWDLNNGDDSDSDD